VTFVRTAAELSRSYIDAHNNHDLDGLLALVSDDVDFKRAGEPALRGKAAVRRQYLRQKGVSLACGLDEGQAVTNGFAASPTGST
jgi:ketosteroid isomerase-like protein